MIHPNEKYIRDKNSYLNEFKKEQMMAKKLGGASRILAAFSSDEEDESAEPKRKKIKKEDDEAEMDIEGYWAPSKTEGNLSDQSEVCIISIKNSSFS